MRKVGFTFCVKSIKKMGHRLYTHANLHTPVNSDAIPDPFVHVIYGTWKLNAIPKHFLHPGAAWWKIDVFSKTYSHLIPWPALRTMYQVVLSSRGGIYCGVNGVRFNGLHNNSLRGALFVFLVYHT